MNADLRTLLSIASRLDARSTTSLPDVLAAVAPAAVIEADRRGLIQLIATSGTVVSADRAINRESGDARADLDVWLTATGSDYLAEVTA